MTAEDSCVVKWCWYPP